jgi:DNA-3-methyladenine glycosylase
MALKTLVADEFTSLQTDAVTAAQRLLGGILERSIDGRIVRVRIVETEAYDQTDVASHSYNGRTPRTEVMFGPAGHAYVYFTYGMHYCFNIVVGEAGYGAGVLIRAVEPLDHEELLVPRRGGKTGVELTNGPAKLCQALAIDRSLSGHNLAQAPLRLRLQPLLESQLVTTTTRVGISRGREALWRFYVTGSPYISVKDR